VRVGRDADGADSNSDDDASARVRPATV